MATYQINRSACFGPDSPGFDDLEIRCTWNGDYLDRANFRISLEVSEICFPCSISPHTMLTVA
ncbi:hypothetical protein BDW59DRAFT_137304 [Aspergillus cavernicola]|uniref:Cyanovirin-N domain-containing protein n=1 Tax=Aspergillus cavernicola TaxID=176166 RepID=A0ABR4J571_9EURO